MAGQVRVKGELIRADREAICGPRIAFIARVEELGRRLSLSSLVRAEGGLATRKSLDTIAAALGNPASKYLEAAPTEQNEQVLELSGEWAALYLESDSGSPVYLVQERLLVEQSGAALRGVYHQERTEHPHRWLSRTSFTMEALVQDDVVTGRYFVDGRRSPMGRGVFQLKVVRESNWAEGFCIFFTDDDVVAVSHNIWLRKSSPAYRLHLQQAEGLIKRQSRFLIAPIVTPPRSAS